MRKRCLLIFPVLCLLCRANSQSVVEKITHDYFRSDPFKNEFSGFLQHLLNDPGITGKVLTKRTDSSLFFFQGTYSSYNPFFFKPHKVEVILSEQVVQLDSLRSDTVFNYQILAYTRESKELKKEFDKIYRHYKGKFYNNTIMETSPGTEAQGATCNFFSPLHGLAPFALTWFSPDENKDICLVLTVRMEVDDNRAILPMPFYTL